MPSSELSTVAIIPAFNESGTIGDMVHATMRAESIEGLVVVDDGSTDGTNTIALLSAQEAEQEGHEKPFWVVSHPNNLGKSEAVQTGVEIAKSVGGSALNTLVFLDADLSPISSRNDVSNKKLATIIAEKLLRKVESPQETADCIESFEDLLARNINALVDPVARGDLIMNIGMLHRTPRIDSIRLFLNWGALSGNRAISFEIWDAMMDHFADKGLKIEGWELEAAMNTFTRLQRDSQGKKLNQSIGKFIMPDVVNIGSRVKAGGFIKGLSRMANVQGSALLAFGKFS